MAEVGGIVGDIVGGIIGGGAGGKSCTNGGVTNAGLILVSNVRTALAVAVAALNVKTSRDMAKLQKEIAEDYASLAEDARNYYNEEYKPLELENLAEVSEEPLYERNKDAMITGQMLLSVRGQFVGDIEDKLICTGRYCTGQRAAMINDALLKQANAEAAVAGMAHRYEDARETAKNTLRWERRREVLNLGRDIPTKAVAYAELASGIFGSIGKQSGTAAEGIAWWAGRRNNRRETEYPDRRAPMSPNHARYVTPGLEIGTVKPDPLYKSPGVPAPAPPPAPTKTIILG